LYAITEKERHQIDNKIRARGNKQAKSDEDLLGCWTMTGAERGRRAALLNIEL